MTLIAALMRNGFTLAISDVMLTAEGPGHVDSPIPTISLPNEEEVVFSGGFHVSGTCRKIFSITDQIWFGFYGSLVEVEKPLAEFRRLCKPGLWSSAEIRNWFEAADFNAMVESGCVVFAKAEEGQAIFCRHVQHFKQHQDGIIDVWAGSGSDFFRSQMQMSPTLQAGGDAFDLMAFGLILTGKMLTLQHRGKMLLSERFGGAFELVGNGAEGFENISKIMYVLRTWWIEGEADTSEVPIEQIIVQGDVRHVTGAIWYVTHEGEQAIVTCMSPSGFDGFIMHPPDRAHTFPPKEFGGVKHVVECLIKLPEGRVQTTLVPTDGYAFEMRGQAATIQISPHLSDALLDHLRSS
jgi:hypothetical protein